MVEQVVEEEEEEEKLEELSFDMPDKIAVSDMSRPLMYRINPSNFPNMIIDMKPRQPPAPPAPITQEPLPPIPGAQPKEEEKEGQSEGLSQIVLNTIQESNANEEMSQNPENRSSMNSL